MASVSLRTLHRFLSLMCTSPKHGCVCCRKTLMACISPSDSASWSELPGLSKRRMAPPRIMALGSVGDSSWSSCEPPRRSMALNTSSTVTMPMCFETPSNPSSALSLSAHTTTRCGLPCWNRCRRSSIVMDSAISHTSRPWPILASVSSKAETCTALPRWKSTPMSLRSRSLQWSKPTHLFTLLSYTGSRVKPFCWTQSNFSKLSSSSTSRKEASSIGTITSLTHVTASSREPSSSVLWSAGMLPGLTCCKYSTMSRHPPRSMRLSPSGKRRSRTRA
mmetsp:Transcript_59715/g.156976  ORF Transcript_59715/g.156976 Transcript_59715/m.156976 type:complete len:277 (-) Transcript_59715:475-1305(-)